MQSPGTHEPGPRHGPAVFDPSAPGGLEMAAEMIRDGLLVAIPTDTVYGIATAWQHAAALDRIFVAKQRDRSKPIPLLVSSIDVLERITSRIDPAVALLLDQFWPGGLTVAIPAMAGMSPALLAADGTVGVRMPNHRLAVELIEHAGGIVACTSANISGDLPARSPAEVLLALDDLIDGVVDGGLALGGVPSTVIGFAQHELVIHREGAVSTSDLARAWAEIHA